MSSLTTLLEKLRALDENATGGFWRWIEYPKDRFIITYGSVPHAIVQGRGDKIAMIDKQDAHFIEYAHPKHPDAQIIIESRNALPLLLEIIEKQREALEKLDKWQGERYCYGSIFTIDDDTFGQMQSLIHGAMEDCDQIAAMVK